MYAGSNSGQMYALDATNGNISGTFASGGTVIDGPSIVDGTLLLGSGYRSIQGTGNNKVYAFSLAGETITASTLAITTTTTTTTTTLTDHGGKTDGVLIIA